MIKHLALAAMTMAGAASTISPAYAEEPDCIKHGREVPCIEMSPPARYASVGVELRRNQSWGYINSQPISVN
jgi:hypothetical protein